MVFYLVFFKLLFPDIIELISTLSLSALLPCLFSPSAHLIYLSFLLLSPSAVSFTSPLYLTFAFSSSLRLPVSLTSPLYLSFPFSSSLCLPISSTSPLSSSLSARLLSPLSSSV